MRVLSCLCLCVIAAVLTACEAVTIPSPMGEPVSTAPDPSLDGTWQVGEHVIFLKHIGEGELRAASLTWKESDFQLQQHRLILSSEDEALYLNLVGESENKDANGPATTRFHFLRLLRPNADTLVLASPRTAVFREAVEQGALPGTIEQSEKVRHIRLDDMDAIHRFVDPARIGEQFDLDKATVLHRISTWPGDVNEQVDAASSR